MTKLEYFIGPTLGGENEALIYCLDSDESSMICPEDQLTEYAKTADKEYVRNNSTFILAVFATSNKDDHFILDAEFNKNQKLLTWQKSIYKKLGLSPTKNTYFVPIKNFAPFAKKLLSTVKPNTISIIGYSFLTHRSFPIDKILKTSKALNAKTSLLALSQKYHFSIPKSVRSNISTISTEQLRALDFPNKALYLKMDGLGGGYNVTKITTYEELKKFTNNQPHHRDLLIQQEVPKHLVEKEHIMMIYPDHIDYIYSAIQITQNNSWYGNIFMRHPTLNNAQHTALFNAAKALQKEGYAHKKGLLVGFDSLANDKEMYIIEINARWLGSLPVARLLKKLDLLDKQTVFSSFDYVTEAAFPDYMQFAEKHLYQKGVTKEFSFIPLAYSAYSTESTRVVYYIVLGNFTAFSQKIYQTFGNNSFTMLNNSIEFITKTSQLLII